MSAMTFCWSQQVRKSDTVPDALDRDAPGDEDQKNERGRYRCSGRAGGRTKGRRQARNTAKEMVPLKPNELTPQERTDDDSRTSCVDVSSMPDTPRTRSPISGLSTRS